MADIRSISYRPRRLIVATGAVGVAGVDAAPVVAAVAQFAPLSPARLMDTRQMSGPTQSGSVFELQVAGRGGVAGTADAASLNVTVTGPAGDGFVTLWPYGTARPNASTLNYSTGVTRANHALAKIGASGTVVLGVLFPVFAGGVAALLLAPLTDGPFGEKVSALNLYQGNEAGHAIGPLAGAGACALAAIVFLVVAIAAVTRRRTIGGTASDVRADGV